MSICLLLFYKCKPVPTADYFLLQGKEEETYWLEKAQAFPIKTSPSTQKSANRDKMESKISMNSLKSKLEQFVSQDRGPKLERLASNESIISTTSRDSDPPSQQSDDIKRPAHDIRVMFRDDSVSDRLGRPEPSPHESKRISSAQSKPLLAQQAPCDPIPSTSSASVNMGYTSTEPSEDYFNTRI